MLIEDEDINHKYTQTS